MATVTYTRGGGGHRPKQKVCVPKIHLQFRAPLINFIFYLGGKFSDVGGWVGGWVGQVEEPTWPRLPFRPPPPQHSTQLGTGTKALQGASSILLWPGGGIPS